MTGEYKSCYKQLNRENKKLLRKICLYVESRYLNEVARDELLVDIAGMALESQKRGEAFIDVIGNDYESFCKELTKNSPKRTKAEGCFLILAWILIVLGGIVPVLALWALIAGDFCPADYRDGMILAPAAYLLKYLIFSVIAVCGWFFAFRYNHKTQTGVILIYLSVLFTGFFIFNIFTHWMPQSTLWIISVPLWMAVFAILVAFALVTKRLVALTAAYYRRKKEQSM